MNWLVKNLKWKKLRNKGREGLGKVILEGKIDGKIEIKTKKELGKDIHDAFDKPVTANATIQDEIWLFSNLPLMILKTPRALILL